MSKDLTVNPQNALAILEQQNTPEAKAIIGYVKAIKEKNIAVLGTDEAFILQDGQGQIKAFKKSLTLSAQDGTLVQPTGYGDHVVSAQGYEAWAEATGASVIFPKEVLVGNDWKPNPYAERDPENRRILAVHARAIAFRYSSMGIPQVSDWTTIFDTPSYRMIDLLAKAKKCPQAFKVLPKDMEPVISEIGSETWASYPFDESMKLWINTSHNEVISWLSQILNREKKAMDFAQTFAKRNALKHLSGIQKVPNWTGSKDGPNQWRFPVLAWRPTGNNIIKWDASQYAELQNRVSGMIDGGSDEFKTNIELKKGSEKVSEDENISALESEIDPEDSDSTDVPDVPKLQKEMSKDVKQAVYLEENFSVEWKQAVQICNIEDYQSAKMLDDVTAVKLCKKVSEILNSNE